MTCRRFPRGRPRYGRAAVRLRRRLRMETHERRIDALKIAPDKDIVDAHQSTCEIKDKASTRRKHAVRVRSYQDTHGVRRTMGMKDFKNLGLMFEAQ